MSCNDPPICGEPASKAVFWPGHAEPIPMCVAHAEGARRIAGAMGFALSVIADLRGETCQSRDRKPQTKPVAP
jgi:hypothetical protein